MSASSSSSSDEPGCALDVTQSTTTYAFGTAPKKTPLGVTTIAHYKTDETYNIGRLIASKPQFICYAVKGNMVRVISTSNSSRILLREHKEGVHDLAFLAGGEGEEALLVTCAKDGLLAVWQLVQEAVELRGEPLVRLQVDSSIHYQRVVAHPADRNLFAACHALPASSDSVVKVFNTEQLLAASKERAGASVDGAMASGLTIRVLSEVISMAFGPDQLLAVGMRNGHVSLFHSGNGSLVHSWPAHDTPVQAVEWTAGGRALLTGSRNNTVLRVWDALSGWQQRHELVINAADSVSNIVTVESASGFVFVASIRHPTLMVFHITPNTFRFDYVCEFPVTSPILSFVSVSKLALEGERIPIHLYCLQTASVQRFELFEDVCLPGRLRTAFTSVPEASVSGLVPFSILPIAGVTLSQFASPQKLDEVKRREQEAAAAETQRQQEAAEARRRAEAAAAKEAAERLAATAITTASEQPLVVEPTLQSTAPPREAPASVDQPALAPSSQDAEEQQRRQDAASRIQKAYRRAHKNVPPANQAEAPDSPATTTVLAPPTPAPASATVTFKDDTAPPAGSGLAPGLLPITALSDKDDKDHKRDSKRRNDGRPTRPGTKTQLFPKLKETDESDKHAVPQSSGDEGRKAKEEEKKDKKRDKVAKPEKATTKRTADSNSLDDRDQRLLAAFQARLDERDRHLAELVSKQVAKQVHEVVLPAMNNAIKSQQDSLRRALLQSVDEAALRGPMQAAFSSCFQQIVLPQFERAVQNMFEQMQSAFDRGLSENLARLPSAAASAASGTDSGGVSALQERNLQLQSLLTENLRTATSTLIQLGDSLNTRTDAKSGGRREKAEKTRLPPASAAPPPTTAPAAPLPDALSMSVLHPKSSAAVAPAPVASPVVPMTVAPSTPVSSAPLIAAPATALKPLPNQLDGLVRRGQFAKAFDLALNAGDLEPVVALCEHLKSPGVILNTQPCPLSSLLLLSLVQQLSFDLNRSASSKLLWIGESLKHLLPTDPDIRDELPGVMQQLQAALTLQQARDPHNTELVALQAAVRARLR